jgi:MFS superfamily sulfate permease-like transporter
MGTGLVFLLGRVLRLGFVSDFIAKPVLKGFTFGVALTVILKQAPKLFGVEGGHGRFFQKVVDLVTALPSTHLPTFAVGGGALVVMWVLKRFAKRVPPALVALVGGIVAVTALHLKDAGVSVIGTVATGLPHPGLPGVRAHHPEELWAAALGIALVAFSELIGAGRTLAARHGYDIDPNRELLAVGAANLVSGLFQGIPVGGGLSGSAANEAAGARSQVSTAVTSVLVVLTLLFLMPLFSNLPDAVLAAIVIEAVRGLVDVRETARYLRLRNGVVPHVGAILGVLVLGVLPGMLLAIVLTIALLLRRLARPRVPELGRIGGTHVFVSVTGHPDAVRTPGLRILRPEGPLMFANAGEVRGRILDAARQEPRPVQVLVNLEATADIDVTAADMLSDVQAELERSGIELALTRVRGRVQWFLERSGALARIGATRVFRSQNDAVEAFEARRARA